MKSIGRYISWLWHNSKGARSAILMNIMLDVFSVGLNLYFIYASKQLIDIATRVRSGSITIACVTLGILVLLRLVVNAFAARLESNTSSRMSFIIRARLYSTILQSQWDGKEKMHSGDAVNRIFTDVDNVTRIITQEAPSLVSTLVQFAAALWFLCSMDARLGLLILLLTPAFIVLSRAFFRVMRNLTSDIRQKESDIQSLIQETLQHRTLVQSFELEEDMGDKLGGMQDAEMAVVRKRTTINVISRTLIGAAFNVGYLVAFLWGAAGIWKGSITFGTMTAFLQLVGQVQSPLMRLTRQIPSFVYAASSIDRLTELEDAPKENLGDPVKMASVPGVRIENLSFSYPDDECKVFDDFSYEFAPGSRTAILGETGVGKSTLIRLMLSLLRPDDGSLTLFTSDEDAPISERTRCNFVYVPQGNTLFSGTIRENLLMGDPDATDERLFEVLGIAAADFVKKLPDGLDTVCGEKGSGLSEGQAQRIAIARGLLRPGGILLLDEFSSSLDSETERRLMENLSRSHIGKTMIFITHREMIASYCDNILKLQR